MGAVRGARAAPRRDTGLSNEEPLWASSLARSPRPDVEEYFPRPPEREEPAAEAAPRAGVPVRGLLAVSVAILAVSLLGLLTLDRGAFARSGVPSAWEDIPMRCEVTGLDGGHLELFRCRGLGGRRLPEGVYRTPDANWISDVTGRTAVADRLVIGDDDVLVGWAVY